MANEVKYTTVDLNATGATTIYDPDHEGKAYGVTMENPGSTAEFQLEVTDGSSTALSSGQVAGPSYSSVTRSPWTRIVHSKSTSRRRRVRHRRAPPPCSSVTD